MVEQISYEELQILPLTKKHRLTSFNSTSSELNDFLVHDALEDQTQMISRTYLCFWKEKLTGFITLLADTLEVKLVHESERVGDYPYKKYPAIKIGRLAVDKRIERKGIGRFLLLAAIGKTISISKEIGCRYITVDSKSDSIVFYEKNKFKMVNKSKSEIQQMYLNMHSIIARMQPKESLDDF